MSAVGKGRYFGLDSDVAERFSQAGTVKEFSVPFRNAHVVTGDADLKAVKRDIEATFDVDMGREGNMYNGFTLGDQAPLLSVFLGVAGHDALVLDYKEAPGGRQLVQLKPAKDAAASIEDPQLRAAAEAFIAGDLERKNAEPLKVERRPPTFKGIPPEVSANVLRAVEGGDQTTLDEFRRLAAGHAGVDAEAVIRSLKDHFEKYGDKS